MEPRFQKTLFGMVSDAQRTRIESAMAPLLYAVPAEPDMTLPWAACPHVPGRGTRPFRRLPW
jgi:hypothetical protein